MYAIFNGLGTPTHLAGGQLPQLQQGARRVRRLRLRLLERPDQATRRRSAGSSTTSARARSSATTSSSTSPGKKIGYFYQNDEFGQDGVKGLDYEIPQGPGGEQADLQPDQRQHRPGRSPRSRRPGAQVVVSFSIPAFTALFKLTSLKLGFKPAARGQQRGHGPDHARRAAGGVRQGRGAKVNGNQLTQGIITDGYLPIAGRHRQQLDRAVQEGPRHSTSPKAPFDGNVLYGEAVGVHVRAGHDEGRQEPHPGRPGQRDQPRAAAGPGGGALRLLLQRSRRR